MNVSTFNNPIINHGLEGFQEDCLFNCNSTQVESENIEETLLDKLSYAADKKFNSIMTPFIVEISKKYLSQDKLELLKKSLMSLPSFNNSLIPEGSVSYTDSESKEQINKILELLKLDGSGSRLNDAQSFFQEFINRNVNKNSFQKELKSEKASYLSKTLLKTVFSYYVPHMVKTSAIKLVASTILDKIEPASVYFVPITYSASVVQEYNTRKHVDTIIEILVPILYKIDEEYKIQEIYELREKIMERIAAIEPSNEEVEIQNVKKMANEMFVKIYSSFHQPLNSVINTAI